MVIGYIDYFINDKHAKIKILAIEESGFPNTDEEQIIQKFTPEGYVFEDSFTSKHEQYKIGDFIRFTPVENSYSFEDSSKDKYKIKSIKTKLDYEVITLEDIMTKSGSIDINLLQSIEKTLPDKFFLQNTLGFYGPFKKINNIVKPSTGTTVEFRESLTNIVSYKEKKIVIGHPEKTEVSIDASNDDQLQKWFREILKSANTPFLKTLLENKNWKKQLFNLPISDSNVEKSKVSRIIEHFDRYEFTLKELKILLDNSDKLQASFEEKIDAYKNEILKERKAEIQEKVRALTSIVSELKAEKNKYKKEIEGLKTKKDQVEKDLNYFSENKERLLADFKVFQSLSLASGSPQAKNKPVMSFLVEKSDTDFDSMQLSKKQFDKTIHHFLGKRSKKTEEIKFRFIREMVATFNCVFSNSLELTLAFIKATNNYRYIISQVEVKWLTFKDFWENGLKDIWISAYDEPAVLHFLILRDCNLSSPECYAAPLLDVDRGLRERLPIDGRPWPSNFRIIATTQPIPAVGLPILKSTFHHWGGLKKIDLLDGLQEIPEAIDGYLSIEEFESWKADKLDISGNYLEEYIG